MKCFRLSLVRLGNLFISNQHAQFLRVQAVRRVFENPEPTGIILIEFNQVHLNQIAQYYASNSLKQFFASEIYSYRMDKLNWWTPVTARARHFLSLAYAFGSKKLILIDGALPKAMQEKAERTLGSIRDNRQLETLVVEGVSIGDLIYDRYLSSNRELTVDINSHAFKASFRESIAYFYRWLNILTRGDVKAICISHCVYHYAIPARIAISLGIPVFEITAGHIFRLDKDNLHAVVGHQTLKQVAEMGTTYYPELVVSVGTQEIETYLKPDPSRNPNLNSLHSSQISIDLPWKLNPNKKTVLIATHLFYDAPHRYGIGLFSDFYEWLVHLGRLSNQTDYNWLIKGHPDLPTSRNSIIEELQVEFPKLQLVPNYTSHATIVKAGVDFVLTVHGSVGFEFPLLGIPVIGSNPQAPYADFEFAITPKNVEEYDALILNLEKISKIVSSSDLISFFYARATTHFDGWLLTNYSQFLKDVGGMNNSMNNSVLKYFAQQPEVLSVAEIDQGIERFLKDGDSFLKRKHFFTQS
jgi:hypothetical protein